MSKRLLTLAAAAAIGLSQSGAMAADEGFYAGLGVGLALVRDAGVKGHPTAQHPTPLDATAAIDNDVAAHAVLGYGFANGLRLEAELGWRENDLQDMAVRQPGSFADTLPAQLRPLAPRILTAGKRPLDGEVKAASFMASLYYDIDLGGGWTPYVGGGLGLARISVTANSKDATLPAALGGLEIPGRLLLHDSDMVFAYQLGGGVGYAIDAGGDRPVVVSLDYRYRAAADPSFTGAVTQTGLDAEQKAHYVGVGVRFGLGF